MTAAAHPAPQVVPQFVASARRPAGVDDERLDDPQQMFGEFVELGIREAEAGPVDVEAPQHGVGELQCDVGRHRLGVGVGPTWDDQQADVLVLREPLQRRGDTLRDGFDGIGDALQVRGHPIEEAARRVHGRRHQQRVGAGEIPVHRLPGDAQSAGDVGDGELRAARVDGLARRVEDPGDRFLVGGGRRSGPAVGAHQRIVRQPARQPR